MATYGNLVTTAWPANVDLETPGTLVQEINKIMQLFMWDNNVHYAQVAVGNGGAQFQLNYALSTIPSADGLATEKMFMLASVSKAFVSAAIFSIYPNEVDRLNTTLSQVFKDLGSPKDARMNSINIQMLVDHTAGFDDNPNDSSNSPDWSYGARTIAAALGHNVTSAQDVVNFLWKQRNLDYNPYNDSNHKMYRYSNVGYVILAHIVAKVKNMTYLDYLSQAITGPLHLNVLPVPTLQKDYPSEIIPPESMYTGPPSYDYEDTTTQVNDVYGGDGMVKEANYGNCCLACNAKDLVDLISKYAVWGAGPGRNGQTLQRDGSTPGASAMIYDSGADPKAAHPYQLAVVLNTRDLPSVASANQTIDQALYTPLINCMNTNYRA